VRISGRSAIICDCSACCDAPDIGAKKSGTPKRTIRTCGDILQSTAASRVFGKRTTRRNSPDLIKVALGEPERAIWATLIPSG
jgi:hypothetical protein